jgi:PiT family inorganic phosphate transporter
MTIVILLLTVLALAYANSANDNFKGVATLFGSGTCTFRKALVWATVTTLAGSLLALVLAHGLVDNFKGKGLVPVLSSALLPWIQGFAQERTN